MLSKIIKTGLAVLAAALVLQTASPTVASAQETAAPPNSEWNWAAYGELNNSKFGRKDVVYDSKYGFGLGVLGTTHLTGNIFLRTGLGFTRYNTEVASTDTSVSMSYLTVPGTILLEVTPNMGIFAGVDLGVNVDKACTSSKNGCPLNGTNTVVFMADLGLRFRVTENAGIELGYQTGLSEVLSRTRVQDVYYGRALYYF